MAVENTITSVSAVLVLQQNCAFSRQYIISWLNGFLDGLHIACFHLTHHMANTPSYTLND